MSEEKQTEPPPCVALIAGLEKGRTAAELESVMRDAVKASVAHKKPSVVILKLRIDPSAADDSVRITPDVDAKVPKAKRKSQTFFADESGKLSRTSKNQPEFPETSRAVNADDNAKNRPGFRIVVPAGATA